MAVLHTGLTVRVATHFDHNSNPSDEKPRLMFENNNNGSYAGDVKLNPTYCYRYINGYKKDAQKGAKMVLPSLILRKQKSLMTSSRMF